MHSKANSLLNSKKIQRWRRVYVFFKYLLAKDSQNATHMTYATRQLRFSIKAYDYLQNDFLQLTKFEHFLRVCSKFVHSNSSFIWYIHISDSNFVQNQFNVENN